MYYPFILRWSLPHWISTMRLSTSYKLQFEITAYSIRHQCLPLLRNGRSCAYKAVTTLSSNPTTSFQQSIDNTMRNFILLGLLAVASALAHGNGHSRGADGSQQLRIGEYAALIKQLCRFFAWLHFTSAIFLVTLQLTHHLVYLSRR